jgi:hypothetical protein
MSTAYAALDQPAASLYRHARSPLAGVWAQRAGTSAPYVGGHRRRDDQGQEPGRAPRQPGYLPRHRRS